MKIVLPAISRPPRLGANDGMTLRNVYGMASFYIRARMNELPVGTFINIYAHKLYEVLPLDILIQVFSYAFRKK